MWLGLIIVVPGMGVALMVRNILKNSNDKKQFKQYIRRTYGKNSSYIERP